MSEPETHTADGEQPDEIDRVLRTMTASTRRTPMSDDDTARDRPRIGRRHDDETYECVPCKVESKPGARGEITVPGGTNGTVWCPWCGDEMQQQEGADPSWDETPVTISLIERIIDAHPDYRMVEHVGGDGNVYLMLQLPRSGELTTGVTSKFLAMISDLGDNPEDAGADE